MIKIAKTIAAICLLFTIQCIYAQKTSLTGQWRINMDLYQDGKVTGDGNDMPAASCLLTIVQQENGSFEGWFSTSTLANKSTTHLTPNEPQVEYASQCPVQDQRLIGQKYGTRVINALQLDESNSQKKWVFNGQMVDSEQIRGSFYGLDCFWGDYTWERVPQTPSSLPPIAETSPQKTVKVPAAPKRSITKTENVLNAPVGEKGQKDVVMAKPAAKNLPNTKQNLETPSAKKITPDGVVTHKVQKGETLYSIARTYNVTVSQLIAINHLAKDSLAIQAGQDLHIR